jgi:hemoglobin
VSTDDRTPFERLGGGPVVRRLVDHFYDAMDTRDDCVPLRALHAHDLRSSRDKLTWFLTGWLGGPPEYVERFGHPRLRARHLPFAIDTAVAEQWMHCMRDALAAHVADLPLRAQLDGALAGLADHMRNRP